MGSLEQREKIPNYPSQTKRMQVIKTVRKIIACVLLVGVVAYGNGKRLQLRDQKKLKISRNEYLANIPIRYPYDKIYGLYVEGLQDGKFESLVGLIDNDTTRVNLQRILAYESTRHLWNTKYDSLQLHKLVQTPYAFLNYAPGVDVIIQDPIIYSANQLGRIGLVDSLTAEKDTMIAFTSPHIRPNKIYTHSERDVLMSEIPHHLQIDRYGLIGFMTYAGAGILENGIVSRNYELNYKYGSGYFEDEAHNVIEEILKYICLTNNELLTMIYEKAKGDTPEKRLFSFLSLYNKHIEYLFMLDYDYHIGSAMFREFLLKKLENCTAQDLLNVALLQGNIKQEIDVLREENLFLEFPTLLGRNTFKDNHLVQDLFQVINTNENAVIYIDDFIGVSQNQKGQYTLKFVQDRANMIHSLDKDHEIRKLFDEKVLTTNYIKTQVDILNKAKPSNRQLSPTDSYDVDYLLPLLAFCTFLNDGDDVWKYVKLRLPKAFLGCERFLNNGWNEYIDYVFANTDKSNNTQIMHYLKNGLMDDIALLK